MLKDPFWFILFVAFTALCNPVFSQAKRAINLIEKSKYEQAEELLYKAISKDSLNAGEKYALSLLYLTNEFNDYDVDSAHVYILEAIDDYRKSDIKTLDKLNKDEITEDLFLIQKNKIEELTYLQAREQHTVATYKNYLTKFSTSLYYDSAVYYRNNVAYHEASTDNNWQSYHSFMLEYPDAEDYDEASTRYERLLFEDKTGDGKLASLENFLKEYPETSHRPATEAAIFKIATGPHTIESYMGFLEKYPETESVLGEIIAKRLYHIIKSSILKYPKEEQFIYKYLRKDSLDQLATREKKELFPILQNGKLSFMDLAGNRPFDQTFSSLPSDYFCGNIVTELLLVYDGKSKIINRNGSLLYSSKSIEAFEDLGNGFIEIIENGKSGLILKSGEKVIPSIADEIKILQGQYAAYRMNDKWGIYSVNQVEMVSPIFSEVNNFDSLIRLYNGDSFSFVRTEELWPLNDGFELQLDYEYEDAEALDNGLIITYSGERQSLVTSILESIVAEDKQELTKLEKGLLIESNQGVRFLSKFIDVNPTLFWKNVDYNANWMSLEGENGWILISFEQSTIVEEYLDSIKILNRSAVLGYKNGLGTLYFSKGAAVSMHDNESLEIVTAPPSGQEIPAYYFKISAKNADRDDILFLNESADTLDVDGTAVIKALGKEYLVISKKKYQGLWDSEGSQLLPAKFDGIANYNDGYVTLLQDGKLGFYRLSDSTYIPPEYQRSVRPYSNTLFIAFKDSGYGIITKQNDAITKFEFDEIKYFNDSVAWVRTEDNWHLYKPWNQSYLTRDISKFYSTPNLDRQYLYYQTSTGKGVLNKKTGTIINATFNDIVNVGSIMEPIFMADIYIDEADYFVVIYYNKLGTIIFREAYTAEEYEVLICEN